MKIGTDIEEIYRFEGKNEKNDEKFLTRIFTLRELSYCFSKSNPAQHLCARFCAKEALIKALSDKTIPLNKIEILNNEDGKPKIEVLDSKIKEKFILSISHCKNYATATVICE